MKGDVIAKRYARALFELGEEEGKHQELLDGLEKIALVTKESSELRSIMESPLYDIILKRKILEDIASRLTVSRYIENFLNILLNKERFAHLAEIRDAYKQLMDEASGHVRATVTTAFELSAEQIEQISEALSKKMNKKVDVDITVEPTLIGGLVAEVEGMIYDGSIKTQISRLKQSLKGEI